MADYTVTTLGKGGLVLDRASGLLPPEVWTDGKNVKFSVEGVSRQWGELPYMATPATENIHLMVPSFQLEASWDVLAVQETKVEYFVGGIPTDITPIGGYTPDFAGPMTGGLLNNLPVFNNRAYSPMYWSPVLAQAAPLPNLHADIRFSVLRPFMNFLIGLGVQDVGAVSIDSNRVMWSAPAEAGSVPISWDPLTSLAGSTPLASTAGELVDCLPLADINYIYANDGVYSQQFVGGQYVFRFSLRFKDFGILTQNCVAAYKNYHFVVTRNDFIIHNGTTWESVGTEKVRRYFKDTLSPSNFKSTFVLVNDSQNEIWVFYPTKNSDSVYPTRALIWNWETLTWGLRDCSSAICGAKGYIKETVVWNDLAGQTWNDLVESWSAFFDPTVDYLPWFATPDGNIQVCSPVMVQAGANFITRVERRTLGFEKKDRLGNVIADPKSHKLVLEVWPILRYITDTVQFYVGGQDDYDSEPYWEGPFDFNPQTDTFFCPAISGKFIALRMEYNGTQDFLLEGYQFKYEEVGVYV